MGIPVVSMLPASLGDTGVMVIAMVLSHLTILIFDSVLVAVWSHIDSNGVDTIDGGKGGIEDDEEAAVDTRSVNDHA